MWKPSPVTPLVLWATCLGERKNENSLSDRFVGVGLTIEKLNMLFLLEASSVSARRIIGALSVIYGIVSFVYIGHFVDGLFSWFPWSGWLFNPLGTIVFQKFSSVVPLNSADATSGMGYVIDLLFYPGFFAVAGLIALVKS
jgi:hypothetical protein